VAEVVKQRAERALDPVEFSGHSLRSGFLTSAAGSGASVFKMMAVSRHKSMDTLSGYVRSAELFQDPAGAVFLVSVPRRPTSETHKSLSGAGADA
jgi:hypothetical protein